MTVLITPALLFIASLTLAALQIFLRQAELSSTSLRMFPRASALAWLTAAFGALLAWGSVFFWQVEQSKTIDLLPWAPVTLFNAAPSLRADSYAWVYALSLGALAAAVILTSPARMTRLSPISWISSLILAMVACLALIADNILALVLVWTALDILEILNTLRLAETPAMSERAAITFSFRAAGTGIALWANLLGNVAGQSGSLAFTPAPARIFLLLAVALRLGVFPLHLAYPLDRGFRRGFGTSLRLTLAATSLVVLARIPAGLVVDPAYQPVLLAVVALGALYAGWKWLFIPDEISARPYWIIGMGALSLAAALRGSPEGSAAWGATLVLFGGLSFLYSARHVWFTRLFAGLSLLLFTLPYTMTATGWMGNMPYPAIFWPIFLIAHSLLIAGYLRHLFRPGDLSFSDLPRWAQAAYPLGLSIFVITLLVASWWGWNGSRQTGNWPVSLILLVVAGILGILFLRLRKLLITPTSQGFVSTTPTPVTLAQSTLASLFWGLYRLLGRVTGYISSLMEGDGGLLWTLLLLVLFISILKGR
jgi:hypothetical protein